MSRPTWSIVPSTPGLVAAGLLLVLGGCATSAPAPPTEPGRAEDPIPAAVVKRPSAGGRMGNAYWHFSKAQMEAREGRLQDAVSEVRLAIKDDPNTAALWVQLSQWLARTEDVTGAIEAAQKAIALDATSVSARLALADPDSLRPLLHLPLSLLVTFLVPLIIASHVVVFWRLGRRV